MGDKSKSKAGRNLKHRNHSTEHELSSVDMLDLETEMKETLDRWPELSPEGKVPTKEFLRCSNLVVRFLETLGMAFSPVSRDVHVNIKKLMSKYVQDPERFKFVEDIVEDEIRCKTSTATEALLWLKRGLNFLCIFLLTLVSDYESGTEPESLVVNLRRSYEATLSVYHGLILKQLFNFLCQASPTRSQLIQRLTVIVNEQDRHAFMTAIKTFSQGLRVNLDALFAFYASKNLYQPDSERQ